MSKASPGMFSFSVWILAVSGLAALGVVGAGSWHRRPTTANGAATAQPATKARQATRVLASMGSLPLAFEANQGQTNPQVKFMARGNGYTVFLTAHDTVFALHASSLPATRFSHKTGTTQATQDRTAAIHMRLLGSNPDSPVTASDQLPGRSNYFIGDDRSQWHTNVPQYERVSYREAYPGVSLAYYGAQKQLEFDFIVAPSASPAPIRLGIAGVNRISTDNSGNLILASSAGNVLLHKPVAYQQKDGERQPVEARFILQAHNQVCFALGNYDRSRELVIDPSVSYATYLGGTAEDDGNAIAVDANGNAWVTGQTKSTDFPTKNPLSNHTANKGGFDVFVTEFSPTGSLLYSTYIGGSLDDSGNAIAVNSSGVFVAGGTKSSDFPVQGGVQSTRKGATNAFVLELSSTGSTLIYSTYLGGTGTDVASGLALDKNGNAYVAGSTTSTDFPPKNPLAGETAGGFVTELNSSGNALVYSTYLGAGSLDFASAVAVDGAGNAYVTGGTESPSFVTTPGVVQPKCGTDGNCNGALYDAFVTVIKPLAAGLVYSTFLGGESRDEGLGITVDGSGNAYVTGVTTSTQFPLGVARLFPTLQGSSDAFVSELNPAGTQLVNSTYLGGSGADVGLAIAVDKNQNAYITGVTGSTNFPTANPTQAKNNGQNDAFVAEFATGGASLVFSTYLGGSLNENTSTASASGGSLAGIAVDSTGASIYVTGSTSSTDFPTVTPEQPQAGGNGSSNGDAFVAKYLSSSPFTITNGALNPTSGHPGASASATITVTSQNGFAGTVALACTVAPAVAKGPTCSFSNASVTLAANGSATSTLNLATTTASARLDRPSSWRSSGIFYATILPLGITLLGAGFGSSGSRGRKLFGFLMLGLLAALLLLPACSSSNGGGGGGGGTPTGTYTITVTGTSGSSVVTGAPALSFTVN